MSTDARQGTTSRVMANVLRYAEAKNLSLTDLAGAAGVQPYRISKWRRGTGSPQPPDGPTPEERIMDAIALAVTHGYVPGDPRFGIADMMVRILTAPGDRYNDIFDAARAANDEAADAEGWDEEREGED
jgi:transcriptional regulator with XRE-family HTH domain